MIYQHNTSFVDMIAKISMCWNAVKKDKPDFHVQEAEERLSFNEHYRSTIRGETFTPPFFQPSNFSSQSTNGHSHRLTEK